MVFQLGVMQNSEVERWELAQNTYSRCNHLRSWLVIWAYSYYFQCWFMIQANFLLACFLNSQISSNRNEIPASKCIISGPGEKRRTVDHYLVLKASSFICTYLRGAFSWWIESSTAEVLTPSWKVSESVIVGSAQVLEVDVVPIARGLDVGERSDWLCPARPFIGSKWVSSSIVGRKCSIAKTLPTNLDFDFQRGIWYNAGCGLSASNTN